MKREKDRTGSVIYRTESGSKIYVEPQNGRPYSIDTLETEIDGVPFETQIREPEDPITNQPTLFAYGLGSNKPLHDGEAETFVELGYPTIIHNELRIRQRPSLIKLILDSEARETHLKNLKNPLIFASRALSEVKRSAKEYSEEYREFTVKGHSKGGPTALMFAAKEPDVKTVILDAPAAFVQKNAFMNHAGSAVPILKDEVIPMAVETFRKMSKEQKDAILKNIMDNPGLLLMEIVFLVAKTPNAYFLLDEIKQRNPDVDIALISHERDRFFPQKEMTQAAEFLLALELLDYYEPVKGTRHVNANENPRGSAEIFHKVMGELAAKKAVKLENEPMNAELAKGAVLLG